MSGRWTSWKATSPVWGTGALLIIVGAALVWWGVRAHA